MNPSPITEPAPPVAELEDVDVPASADPDSCVIHAVQWTVSAGQWWVLTGRSGAGKSSLLQVVAGLMRPVRGRFRLFGADLESLSERERVAQRIRIGMVFGGGGRLFPHLSVAENIALPLFYHGRERTSEALQRVGELLEALGLTGQARKLPRELPRRVVQRAALARALALAPEALLLDDPGSGLGDAEMDWWKRFVRDCAAGKLAACRSVRTMVLAVPEALGWVALADNLAHVGSDGWRVAMGPEAREQMLHPTATE